MNNYTTYTMEEIATDPFFREWVITPTQETSDFWNHWLEQNPEHFHKINKARALVIVVHERYKDDLSNEAVQHEIEELIRLTNRPKKERHSLFSRFTANWIRIAALFLLISGLGIGWYYKNQSSTAFQTASHVKSEEDMITKENTSSREVTIVLNDGSVATLEKGSRLTYPLKFGKNSRKVFLTGEAFFDVTKDPGKPFLVYANETVTKVLGTRFRVKAFETDNTVTVAVKAGKVSVYPEKDFEILANPDDNKTGVILNPNQQAIFNRKENKMEKGQVINPKMLQSSSINKELTFDDRPVSEVFKTLEDMYAIKIVFNEESLSHCSISTSFSEETLKQRLNAICQAIDAGYEVADGQFVIHSKGCEK